MHAWGRGTVDISGGRLAYHRTGGDHPALVLSHGLTDNGLCWTRLAAALALRFDVIMLDARGHGESSRVFDVEPHDPGEDLAEAIHGLALNKPIVMGHSVGARATALCAGAYPNWMSKVILEDPPFLPLADPLTTERRRKAFCRHVETFQAMSETDITTMGKAQSPGWDEDDFPAWTTAKKQVDPAAYPHYSQGWQDAVAAITARTLLIYGEHERGGIVTAEVAEEAKRVNPRVSAIQIRGAGHNIRRENFSDYLSAVEDFLASTPQE